jgi:hypothetical protein
MIARISCKFHETLLGKHGYAAPADACISYQTLYKTLTAFEADLHQRIHLENNILFPRAITTEQARRSDSLAGIVPESWMSLLSGG